MSEHKNLALDRCDLHGIDPEHSEDCWQVIDWKKKDEKGHHLIVLNHIPYRQAIAMVMNVPLSEIETQIVAMEHETPEKEQQWWDHFLNQENEI